MCISVSMRYYEIELKYNLFFILLIKIVIKENIV